MNIALTEIQLFNLLRSKIGEEQAESIVGFVQSSVKHELEKQAQHLATKEDLAILKGELSTNMAKKETRMILWAFVFWATQLAAMFAFLKFFIGK